MDKVFFSATVNWTVEGDAKLENAIKCSWKRCEEDEELEETVAFESCIHLRNDSTARCILKVENRQQEFNIGQIIIISEAKRVEIYSEKEEYMSTIDSKFIMNMDEFTVHKAVVNFGRPVQSCAIKFLSLKNPKEFWLYGIRIMLQPSPALPITSNSAVDLSKVMERVKQCDKNLSEKARGFASFLSTYQNHKISKITSQTDDDDEQMMGLLKNLSMSASSVSTMRKRLGQGDEKYFRETDLSNSSRLKNQLRNFDRSSESPTNDIIQQMTAIVKIELQKCEERIWKRLDARLQTFETRQMKILEKVCLLTDLYVGKTDGATLNQPRNPESLES